MKLVTPDAPSSVELYAAKLLQKYIEKITKQQLEITIESNVANSNTKHIFIGNCQKNKKFKATILEKPETLFLRSSPRGVHVTGSDDRGILYYIMARMLWSEESWKDILDDIAPGYFGSGYKFMVKYYYNWENFIANNNILVTGVKWKFPQELNDKEFIAKQKKLLKKARKLAQTEEEALRIDQVTLEMLTMEIYLAGNLEQLPKIVLTDKEYIIDTGSEPVPAAKLYYWHELAEKLNITDIANFDSKRVSIDTAATVWKAEGNKHLKTVSISNRSISLQIIPDAGGRIISVKSKDNDNFLFVPENLTAASYYGGYEEYAGLTVAAGGWQNKYTWKKINNSTIKLTCELKNQKLALLRIISLDQNRPIVHIKTQLINKDNKTRKLSLRSRMMMPDSYNKVLIDNGDGLTEFQTTGKRESWLSDNELPQKSWAITNDNYQLIN